MASTVNVTPSDCADWQKSSDNKMKSKRAVKFLFIKVMFRWLVLKMILKCGAKDRFLQNTYITNIKK